MIVEFEPFSLRVFPLYFLPFLLLPPPSLRATSPIFCDAKHPVRLRDTAGEECEIFQRFCFTGVLSSPILRLLLLSIADEGGEKPMLDSVSVTVGIFRHFH